MSAAILSQIVGNLFTRGIVYGRGMKRTTIAFALLTAFVLTGYWLWQAQESALRPPTIPQPTLEARRPHPCRPIARDTPRQTPPGVAPNPSVDQAQPKNFTPPEEELPLRSEPPPGARPANGGVLGGIITARSGVGAGVGGGVDAIRARDMDPREEYQSLPESRFIKTGDERISTFSADVDTASYSTSAAS